MNPTEALSEALELAEEASYEEALTSIRRLPRSEILSLFNEFEVGAYLLAQSALFQELDNPFEHYIQRRGKLTGFEVHVLGCFNASPLGDEALHSWIEEIGGTVVSEIKSEATVLLLGEGFEELPEVTEDTAIALEQHLLDAHNQFMSSRIAPKDRDDLLTLLRSKDEADQLLAFSKMNSEGCYNSRLLPRITYLRIFSQNGDVKHEARNAFQRSAPLGLKLHVEMLIEHLWGYYKLDRPRHFAQRLVELALALPMDVAFFEEVCGECRKIDSLYLRSLQNRVGFRAKHLGSFLSEMITCFKGLKSLDLTENEIASVPKSIALLRDLEELRLESNENWLNPEGNRGSKTTEAPLPEFKSTEFHSG